MRSLHCACLERRASVGMTSFLGRDDNVWNYRHVGVELRDVAEFFVAPGDEIVDR